MYNYSVRQMILLHLIEFNNIERSIEYGAPAEITQDGIAASVGITRSHASTALIRLRKAGLVTEGLSRIKGSRSKVKRKIYFLTEPGKTKITEFLAELRGSGVPESELKLELGINRLDSKAMAELPGPERRTAGMLCVTRKKLNRKDLGFDAGPAIPFDSKGNLWISPDARERLLETADPGEIRNWHSMAADLYRETDGLFERLYHLAKAGRLREAARLAETNRHRILETGTPDTLSALTEICSSKNTELCAETVLLALRLGFTDRAREILEMTDDPGRTVTGPLLAEILLRENRPGEALSAALDTYSGDVLSSLALGKCMNAAGRYEEALVYLRMCRKRMLESGCLFRMDEVLEEESAACRETGNATAAEALKTAAEASRKGIRGPDSP